jgi:hypothetical protein
MLSIRYNFTILLVLLLTAFSGAGYAASITIDNAPTGNSEYTITARDMPEVAGIQLSISYDMATLATPVIQYGSFSSDVLKSVGFPAPGSIIIVFVSSGSVKVPDVVAKIAFTKLGNLPAPQPRLTVNATEITTLSPLAVKTTEDTTQLAVDPLLSTDKAAADQNLLNLPKTNSSTQPKN